MRLDRMSEPSDNITLRQRPFARKGALVLGMACVLLVFGLWYCLLPTARERQLVGLWRFCDVDGEPFIDTEFLPDGGIRQRSPGSPGDAEFGDIAYRWSAAGNHFRFDQRHANIRLRVEAVIHRLMGKQSVGLIDNYTLEDLDDGSILFTPVPSPSNLGSLVLKPIDISMPPLEARVEDEAGEEFGEREAGDG